MEKGIITFSFDDGRKDTYHVFNEILKPLSLPGVVYIPSGYIETGFNDPLDIGYNGLMTKAELDVIQSDPLFEVAAHGWMHKNSFDDVEKGILLLREWYPDQAEFGFASPHSAINKTYVEENEKEYRRMGFSYVRGGRNIEYFRMLLRAISLLARTTKSPALFKLLNLPSMNKSKSYYLHAVGVHKLNTLQQLKGIVDYCASKKCWAILEFHGIDRPGSKEYSEIFCWSEDDFMKLCEYAVGLRDSGMLDVLNPLEAIKRV